MAVYQISFIHLVVFDFWIYSCLLRSLPGFAFGFSTTQVGKVKGYSCWLLARVGDTPRKIG